MPIVHFNEKPIGYLSASMLVCMHQTHRFHQSIVLLRYVVASYPGFRTEALNVGGGESLVSAVVRMRLV